MGLGPDSADGVQSVSKFDERRNDGGDSEESDGQRSDEKND